MLKEQGIWKQKAPLLLKEMQISGVVFRNIQISLGAIKISIVEQKEDDVRWL